MIPYGSLVVYVTPAGKSRVMKLTPDEDRHTGDGVLRAESVHEANFGEYARTTRNVPFLLRRAGLADTIMGIKRRAQIIYPKDIAWICLKLGAGPGKTIFEAGCGSGGLTLALSWFCGPTGRVVSHEARGEFAKLARRNLEWANLGENVVIYERDIGDGFPEGNADALFLDMRESWLYLDGAFACLKPGGTLGFLLPTVNQLNSLSLALERQPAGDLEIMEILLRHWKTEPDRLRPRDRMPAHTGFLVFCRREEKCADFENWEPKDTRERKRAAAREARAEELIANEAADKPAISSSDGLEFF